MGELRCMCGDALCPHCGDPHALDEVAVSQWFRVGEHPDELMDGRLVLYWDIRDKWMTLAWWDDEKGEWQDRDGRVSFYTDQALIAEIAPANEAMEEVIRNPDAQFN